MTDISNQINEPNQIKSTVMGTVVSAKMKKTIIVQVMRKVKHPLYGKYLKKFTKMYAHDEDNICKVGDIVTIQQSRPISRLKRWKLVEIVKNTVL